MQNWFLIEFPNRIHLKVLSFYIVCVQLPHSTWCHMVINTHQFSLNEHPIQTLKILWYDKVINNFILKVSLQQSINLRTTNEKVAKELIAKW